MHFSLLGYLLYLTYEELTLYHLTKLPFLYFKLYLTYEELTPSESSNSFQNKGNPLYLTYEELTLIEINVKHIR